MQSDVPRNRQDYYNQQTQKINNKPSFLKRKQQIQISLLLVGLLIEVSLKTSRQKLKIYLLILTLGLLFSSGIALQYQAIIALIAMAITLWLSVLIGKLIKIYIEIYQQDKNPDEISQTYKIKVKKNYYVFIIIFMFGYGVATVSLILSFFAAAFTLRTKNSYLKVFLILIALTLSTISGMLVRFTQKQCQKLQK